MEASGSGEEDSYSRLKSSWNCEEGRGLRRRGGGGVEVGGLARCQLKQLVGRLCEAQQSDRTCTAWKTVLGFCGGLGRALAFGALGRVGQ